MIPTTPIWWSPLTRERPPSPIRRTRSRSRAISGWAMPSRPAARPATTKEVGHHRARRLGGGERHFREMDVDIGVTPFTVIGGRRHVGRRVRQRMLRETTIKLVAGLRSPRHLHRSNPDPAKSFAERQRLFDLPRSSWQDYDKALISRGGGVFPRSLKEIPLSAEMKALLKPDRRQGHAIQVMSAILKAQADLCSSAGSAPMCALRARPTSRSATAPMTRSASSLRLNCKVIGEGRQSRHDPARPHRGGAITAYG